MDAGVSKWCSEEVWRDALALKRRQIEESERPDYILWHRGAWDEAYTAKRLQKLRHSFERIKVDGLQEWRERPLT